MLSSVFAVNGSTETWLTRATELTHSLLNVSNTVYSNYNTTWTTISRLLSQLFCRYSINSFSFLCIFKMKILVCFLTWNEHRCYSREQQIITRKEKSVNYEIIGFSTSLQIMLIEQFWIKSIIKTLQNKGGQMPFIFGLCCVEMLLQQLWYKSYQNHFGTQVDRCCLIVSCVKLNVLSDCFELFKYILQNSLM